MITVQPYETFKHLAGYIGHLMQKYRTFQNLLGLRATELKVVSRPKNAPIIHIQLSKANEEEVESAINDDTIGNVLKDGDEFIFKVSSFDKWITIQINFELVNHKEEHFSTKIEMRVAGYFQNSHLFNLIQK